MSLVTDLASGGLKGIGEGVAALGGGITDFIAHVQGKLSPAEQAQLEALAQQAVQHSNDAQAKINEIEAASESKFKSNWRPAIGWICAISLMLMYWPKAIITTVIWAMACVKAGGLTPFPDLGLADLLALIVPMLGIAGMRTTEKVKGVT